MPDTPSITINKEFMYRGAMERWSNTYHFSGTTPGSAAAWKTLADAIWTAEAQFYTGNVRYAGHLGYEAGNQFAVSIRDYPAEGIAMDQGVIQAASNTSPGDAAVWVRWATPDRNSNGKIIYLRKYFHGVASNKDDWTGPSKTAAETYATKMKDGSLPGGFKICGPQGAVAGAHKLSPYVSFRQLKRTGKRPSR